MKYRWISGWVTVTGPPRLICSSNLGTTLPLLPRTFPNRTARNRFAVHDSSPADQLATRLVAPMTLDGIDRLVGRDQDEAFDAIAFSRFGDSRVFRRRCS